MIPAGALAGRDLAGLTSPLVFLALLAIVTVIVVRRRRTRTHTPPPPAPTSQLAEAQRLIDEVKHWSNARLDEQKADYERRIGELRRRHDGAHRSFADQLADVRTGLDEFRSGFTVHKVWDDDALAKLRVYHPDHPDPPVVIADCPPRKGNHDG